MKRISTMPSPYRAMEYVSGKNLFDINKVKTRHVIEEGGVVNNGNGTLSIYSSATSSSATTGKLVDYAPTLQVGETYAFSGNNTGTQQYVYLLGSNRALKFGNSYTISQADLDSWVYWYGMGASNIQTPTVYSDIQIELGTASTPYSPYQRENELHMELCKGGYFSTEDEYGLKVVGKTEQKTLSGKNLVDYVSLAKTANIYVSGDEVYNSQTEYYGGGYETTPISPGTYTVSVDVKNEGTELPITNGNIKLIVFYGDNSEANTWHSLVNTIASKPTLTYKRASAVFTVPNDGVSLRFKVCCIGGAGANPRAISKNLQIEKGSTSTSYEPYCGGVPSPNPNYPQPIQCVKAGTKVSVVGKNLFDVENLKELMLSAATYNDVTNILRVSRPQYIDTWLAIYPEFSSISKMMGKTITVSLSYRTSPESDGYLRIGSWLKNSDGTRDVWNDRRVSANNILYLSNNPDNFKSVSYTTPILNDIDLNFFFEDSLRISLYANASGTVTSTDNMWIEYKDIQIEISDTATPYEPYISGGTVTTPCDLYEGDIWYPMSGKVVKNKYHVSCTGNMIDKWEEWHTEGSYHGYNITCSNAGIPIGLRNERVYSNYFRGRPGLSGGLDNYAYSSFESLYLTTSNFGTSGSLANFQAWLREKEQEGNPLSFVYELAEPMIEQYDPQPIFMPPGTVHVIQNETDLKADLSATALIHK